MAAAPKKLSDYLAYNAITNPGGGFNIQTSTPSTIARSPAPINFAAPLGALSPFLVKNPPPVNFSAPLGALSPSIASMFKSPTAPAPVAPGAPQAAPIAPAPAADPPVVQHTTALPGGPSGSPILVPPGQTGAAPPNQTPIPPQWKNPDGSLKSPEQIASEVGGALKAAHGTADVGKLALDQFGNQNKSAADLEAEARRIGNTRNDIAVGETDPYKVASASGIAYTPAELSAIEKAYSGVYDPALDTALAKVTAKQTSDASAADAKAREDQIRLQADLDSKKPYTLGKNDVRYDGEGNPIAVGLGDDTAGGGTYTAGQNPVVDAYVKGFGTLYKASDIPDQYKDLVAQGVAGNKPTASKTSTDAISLITELQDSPILEKLTGNGIFQHPSSIFAGSDVQAVQNIAKQLNGILSLQNRTQLKGQGAISDFEFRVLQDAASALGINDAGRTNLNPEDFKKELNKLKLKLSVGETDLPDDELLHFQEQGYTPEQIRDYSQSLKGSVGNTTASTQNRPQRNNNPGNVKAGGLADSLATGKDDQNHLIFPDAAAGFKALTLDLTAKINGASQYLPANPTIAQLGKVYAEDPNWPKKVAMMLGVGVDTKTQSVPLDKLVKAVATQEGYYA